MDSLQWTFEFIRVDWEILYQVQGMKCGSAICALTKLDQILIVIKMTSFLMVFPAELFIHSSSKRRWWGNWNLPCVLDMSPFQRHRLSVLNGISGARLHLDLQRRWSRHPCRCFFTLTGNFTLATLLEEAECRDVSPVFIPAHTDLIASRRDSSNDAWSRCQQLVLVGRCYARQVRVLSVVGAYYDEWSFF